MLEELEKLVKQWEKIGDPIPEPAQPKTPTIKTQADLDAWQAAAYQYRDDMVAWREANSARSMDMNNVRCQIRDLIAQLPAYMSDGNKYWPTFIIGTCRIKLRWLRNDYNGFGAYKLDLEEYREPLK